MKKAYLYILIAAVSFAFFACADNDGAETGPLTLHFDNVVGTTNLQLNTTDALYENGNGEAYKITGLRYYVSNIKLKKSDGTTFIDAVTSDGSSGYYLIDESDATSQDVTLENIPAGDYVEVTFTIGVDADQVDQGAQTGPLDPALGLFWSWNSGYIFLSVEGVSPVSTEDENVFEYHVGGYKEDAASNQVNNLNDITLSFNGDMAPVRTQHEPEVHLLFDLSKFLNGAGEMVTFASSASRHSPMACQNLAENISEAFLVDHVHAN